MPFPMPSISFRSKSLVALPVFTTALALRAWICHSGFFYDDGMIVLRVSENLAHGDGFCYNVGEHVQAATSLLWALLGALAWMITPRNPFLLMRATGALFDSLAAVGLALLVMAVPDKGGDEEHDSPDRIITGLVTGLFYGAASTAALGAPSGLETGLYTFLIVFTFLALVTSYTRLAVIMSVVLILVRPDGILVAGIFACYLMLYDRRRIRFVAVTYSISGLLYLVGTYSYFHNVLPQTVIAKQLFRHSAANEWSIVLDHFFWGAAIPTGLLALVGIFDIVRGRPGLRILLFWSALYTACFATFSQWWPWYLPPIVLAYAVCVGTGFELALRTVVGAFNRAQYLRPMGIALGLLLALSGAIFTLRKVPAMSQAREMTIVRGQRVASLLTEASSATDTVMLEPLGIIGFYTPRTFYDYPGLASPRTADVLRSLHSEVSRVPDEPTVMKVLLARVKPNFLVLRQHEYETDEAANALSSCHLFATVPVSLTEKSLI